jgi:hypothetical protein
MFPYLPPYPAGEGVSVRIAFILNAAMAYVASRLRQAVPGMGDIIVPLWAEKLINGWLGARRAAIVALVRRIEAGTQKPPQPYKARAAKAGAAKAETARKVAGIRMPHFRGWLFAVGRELSLPGIQLGTLLNEDMRAMVCAHPRLARLIRPLLRAMGETVPAWFPRAPTRARAKRTARPAWRTAEAGGGRDADPAWDLVRFIEAARLREYVAGMERLYPGWTRGQAAGQAQLPPVPRPVPFVRASSPDAAPVAVEALAPVAARAPVSAEPALDRDRYYYAETWNGKLIPVRRRWG